MPKTTLILGGGLAGLSAAVELTRAGMKVRLLEARTQVGGRAETREREGFHLNLGAHALYATGPAMRTLRRFGVQVNGRAPALNGASLLFGAELARLPGGFGGLAFSPLFTGGRLSLLKLFASVRSTPPAELARVTAEQWLLARCPEPKSRMFVKTLIRLTSYCQDAELVSADAVSAQLARAQRGVMYLDRGWQPLVQGLVSRAEALGASVETGAAVRRLLVSEGRVSGVQLADGRRLDADAVIVAASPSVMTMLLPNDRECQDHAAHARPVRAACLDVALAPEAVLRRELVLGVESPLYASLHSGAARLAPEGAHLVHLVRYLGADEAPDPEAVREELTGLLDHMGPNLRQHVRFTRYLPHVTVAHDQPQARRGGLPGRPPVRHGSIAGLYRAGDWVGAEGLLADASVASAIEAARALIADAALRAA